MKTPPIEAFPASTRVALAIELDNLELAKAGYISSIQAGEKVVNETNAQVQEKLTQVRALCNEAVEAIQQLDVKIQQVRSRLYQSINDGGNCASRPMEPCGQVNRLY